MEKKKKEDAGKGKSSSKKPDSEEDKKPAMVVESDDDDSSERDVIDTLGQGGGCPKKGGRLEVPVWSTTKGEHHSDGEHSNRSSDSTTVPEDFLIEWDEQGDYADGYGAKALWDPLSIVDTKDGKIIEEVAAASIVPTTMNTCTTSDFTKTLVEERYVWFPSMPCVPSGPITQSS